MQNLATKKSQFQVLSVFVDMTGSTYNLVVNMILSFHHSGVFLC